MMDQSVHTSPTLDAPRPVIRPMTEGDLADATELSSEQQWPHRDEDWALFLELGEGLVAEQDGKVIGTTMAWRFGQDVATLGSVIVSNAAQGQGIGRKLMEGMIAQLGNRTIVLNSTEAGQPLYAKLGFAETGTTIFQYQGIVPDVPLADLLPGDRVRPKGKADGKLATLFSAASGMDRQALFHTLAANSRTVVLSRNNAPAGFAMLRRFGRGWVIGPVVAPDADGAKALILHWLAVKQGSFCRIDIPGESGLGPWFEELGLPCVGTVLTMARGPAPVSGPEAKVFALAAQALG